MPVLENPSDATSFRNSTEQEVMSATLEIPDWMNEYFQWHAEQVADLNENTWDQKKYLVMRCLKVDDHCGGASDRLKQIPMTLLVAHQMKRILMIKWERPHRLEEFLLPPVGGLNWTIPTWLDRNFEFGKHPNIISEKRINRLRNKTNTLLDMRYQSYNHGSAYYDQAKADGEPEFDKVYRQVWSKVFEPSPPVAAMIQNHTQGLGLVPENYVTVHVRAQYTNDQTGKGGLIRNGINCASQLDPSLPIYITADSTEVVKQGLEYVASMNSTRLAVARDPNAPAPLHLDRGSDFLSADNTDWSAFPPEAYYDIFVDLYMIGQGRCLTIHQGGFGRWGHLLMKNQTCGSNHGKKKCDWADDVLVE